MEEVVSRMTNDAEEFGNLAKALKKSSRFRFLSALLPDKDQKGAAIYHYKGGSLQQGKFSKPEIRDVKTVTNRRDLLWYATDLTLDPDTANGYLGLTEENKKATCESWLTYPDHPERFDARPQVLCKEGLTGKHYWEVVWNNGSKDGVGVAVAYAGIGRKGNSRDTTFGYNSQSWYFGECGGHNAWHDYKEVWKAPIPPTGCNKVGVYLDWPAGTLSFYSVSSDTLRHLYTFQATFTEPLFPGLWIYNYYSYATLSPIV
ncbi:neoverrucotoxin subunit alpha-like [Parambassis ranga]|uniref:Neoverrucotoxin subunit alpha-like n=1 Tax=Parambassis ranga TaxID=210632 RepID=A0A6P7IS89_9TELE|nr:neoverrucotoxin subunit alpha-like [Parambassis ranga]